MEAKVTPGPIDGEACVREAVCIHTNKIFDSCRDKDCLEDLRVYLTASSQEAITTATSIRSRCAELVYASANVEPVTFNRGCYTVDIRYYYRLRGEVCTLGSVGTPVTGLAVFSKRVLLYGSEGSVKVFRSCEDTGTGLMACTRMPVAVVEAVDPIVLSMRIVDVKTPPCETDAVEIPREIACLFDEPLVMDNTCRQVLVTLGQFSIVRLERDSQLLIPAYDYCIPEKVCCDGECTTDDPCAIFSRIEFPVDEFFPPDSVQNPCGYKEALDSIG